MAKPSKAQDADGHIDIFLCDNLVLSKFLRAICYVMRSSGAPAQETPIEGATPKSGG